MISYEGYDVKSLKTNFQEAVDDYLEICRLENTEPEKPFKGSFNVRLGSELHRRAVIEANKQGVNLNKLVTNAIDRYLDSSAE